MLSADVEAMIANAAHRLPTERPSLDTIGRRCGTDKAANWHGYLDFYERFFAPLRDRPIRLLEIGVFRGQSVKMWSEYFQAGRIIGADIDPAARQFAGDRITIEIADQSNIAHLMRLGMNHGPFDIVLDDGSHVWNHQITALQYLYAFVKPGGYFVVEDLDTSFGAYVETHKGNSDITAMQYLAKFAQYVVGDAQLDIDAEPDPFIRTFARSTEFVAFHRRTAILRRHPASTADRTPAEWNRRDVSKPSLVATPLIEGALHHPGSLTVHMGFHGDVTTQHHLVGGVRGSSVNAIQGFTIQLDNAAASDLEYRVMGAGNVWSEWMACGTFAGTRGRGVPLRGFAVRLGGALAEAYRCTYAGAFEGSADVVLAEDGQLCQASDNGPLEAMHVVLRPHVAG